MVYITVKQPRRYHQMTLEELFSGKYAAIPPPHHDGSNTRTVCCQYVPINKLESVNIPHLIHVLESFNESTANLRKVERSTLYHHFNLPKKSGGTRPIDAPNPALKASLRWLVDILDGDFAKRLYSNSYVGALYHTAAFGYVENRDTVKALRRHTFNNSRWYAKCDVHNFFGSITIDYAMNILSQVFPFSEIVKVAAGKKALYDAIELGFLNGSLPQGSPLSPMLTNILMIPFDYQFSKKLREIDPHFIYTRWADDFQVSNSQHFNWREIEDIINDLFKSLGASCRTNNKTRYGSNVGRNWNLGLMVNSKNEITIGRVRKRQLQAAMFNYVTAKQSGKPWGMKRVHELSGNLSYFKHIEKESYSKTILYMNKKLNTDIESLIREDLKIT